MPTPMSTPDSACLKTHCRFLSHPPDCTPLLYPFQTQAAPFPKVMVALTNEAIWLVVIAFFFARVSGHVLCVCVCVCVEGG